MVSNISSCTKVLVLPIVLWVVSSFSLRAQEKDFATWANAGFEYKLKPALTVSGGLEWRTKDDLGKTDRWGLKVGGSYKLLPFLKLGAGYETHSAIGGRMAGSSGTATVWKALCLPVCKG